MSLLEVSGAVKWGDWVADYAKKGTAYQVVRFL